MSTVSPIRIHAADGTSLSADVYIPHAPQPAQGFPAIIFINSWALSKEQYLAQGLRLADDGYLVVSYSARGWGLSDGYVGVAGPDDVGDIRAVVDWVIDDGRADPSRVGIGGISYGGGLSLLGLAHDERIKTAAAMSGWANLKESFYGGRSPRLLWGAILLISGRMMGDLHHEIEEKYKKLLSHQDIEETLAWAYDRSPLKYLANINDRKAPVYISQNMSDPLFQPNSVIDLYTRLVGPKRLDLNQGSHATAEGGGLLGAENYVWEQAHAWFDHWLKGIDDDLLAKPRVSIELPDVVERWTLPDWPDTDALRERFYLRPRDWIRHGRLARTPAAAASSNRIATGIFSGANVGTPVIGAILDAHLNIPRVTWIYGLNRISSCAYLSPRFTKTRRILGAPKISVWIEPSRPQVQLVAHLYEVNRLGWGRFITHGPVTRLEARPGEVEEVKIELVTTAHQVEAGAALALVIDTYDPQYMPPTLKRYDVKIHYSPEHASELAVPFLS